MAQAAAAQDLSQEELHAPEQAEQAAKTPEKGELGKALESGSQETVVSIFKKDATAAKEAISRLDVAQEDVNPAFLGEVPAAKGLVEGVKAANESALKKTEEAEEQASNVIYVAFGKPANEAPPAPAPVVEAKAEPEFSPEEAEKLEAAAAKIEPLKVMEAAPAPVEVPKPIEAPAAVVMGAPAERNEMAEQQKHEAEESMKEDLDALQSFAKEHGLHLDSNTLLASDAESASLTPVERTYMAVLHAKYHAGDASKAHAEALMAVATESDPAKKKELAAHAFELSEISSVKEKAATILNSQYMALPEIIALSGGNPTGGSYGGQDFEQPPAAGAPPQGPEGPKGPDLTLLKGGADQRLPGGGGEPLYNEHVYGKPAGIASIAPIKTEGGGEKVPPTAVDNWFSRNFRALGGFFGMGGGDKDRH